MAALQVRALARAGYAVLQIDLLGCGDSTGGFGDATWNAWVDDIVSACRWLHARSAAPLWLWGLRAGCLLAVDAARRFDPARNFLFWQPAVAGKPLLQQFLRLQMAADLLDGKARGAVEGLRRQLDMGHHAEVAGYALSPSLAFGLEQAKLEPPGKVARLEWIELSTRDDGVLSPAATSTIDAWRPCAASVRGQVVRGPAFWQTIEIEEAPALIDASVAALNEDPVQ